MTEEHGVTAQQIFNMLMESQYWPAEDMLDYQRSQLEQLLKHAKANVPFYKTRLDCVFRRDGSIDWDRWEDIPIVTREDLRDRREEMQALVLPRGHGPVSSASSSGSTGVPITVTFPKLLMVASIAAWDRMYEWHGIRKAGTWVEFKLKDPRGQYFTSEYFDASRKNDLQKRIHVSRQLSARRKIELLKSLKFDVLVDTPNSAEILARVNLVTGANLRIPCVIGIGMGFSPAQRALLAESFGARTISPYSSKEGGLMASQCPASGHFHLNAEQVYLEYLPISEMHSDTTAVITPFFNTAQPLIRYDQGDIVVAGRSCVCGRHLPVLQAISGRNDAILNLPDREVAVTGLDFEALRVSLAAIATQIAQVGPVHLEIRYVADEDATVAGKEEFEQHVKYLLGDDLRFSFNRVDDIPSNAGGKQQRIVREYEA